MNLTIDQLTYILQRKFTNIVPGKDFIVSATIADDTKTVNTDASIIEWNIDYISKPTDEELSKYWDILKDQYNSDESRVDSEMFKLVYGKQVNKRIVINEDIK